MKFLKKLFFDYRRKQHLKLLWTAKGLLRMSQNDSTEKTNYVCIAISQATRKGFLNLSYKPEIWSHIVERIHLKGHRSVYRLYDDLLLNLKKFGLEEKDRLWIFEDEWSDEIKGGFYFNEFCVQKLRHIFIDFLIEEVEKGNYDHLDCIIKPFDFRELLLPEVRNLLA